LGVVEGGLHHAEQMPLGGAFRLGCGQGGGRFEPAGLWRRPRGKGWWRGQG
jgi:hypothetical protein